MLITEKMDSEFILVFVTSPDIENARIISQLMLKNKKAACVNIVPLVNSLFWWKDKIENNDESLLLIKTKSSLLGDLIELVKKNHPYEIPEIIALPITGSNPDYLKWMSEVFDS